MLNYLYTIWFFLQSSWHVYVSPLYLKTSVSASKVLLSLYFKKTLFFKTSFILSTNLMLIIAGMDYAVFIENASYVKDLGDLTNKIKHVDELLAIVIDKRDLLELEHNIITTNPITLQPQPSIEMRNMQGLNNEIVIANKRVDAIASDLVNQNAKLKALNNNHESAERLQEAVKTKSGTWFLVAGLVIPIIVTICGAFFLATPDENSVQQK